jgi:hypothetical protein
VSVLSGVALDITTLVPGLECSPTWDAYTSLLIWTLGPIGLYAMTASVVMLNAWRAGRDVRGALVAATGRALVALSLIHTLICVQIFQTFDCDSFDVGDEKGPTIDNSRTAFLSSSYAINCNTKTHGGYEAYAIFMIVVYVAILPAAMTWFRWRQHQRSASFGYYTPSFWWFDTYDLFYRLTMTGFLLVISQNSDKVRMIASTFVSIAFLFYVTTVRPFLQESHNMVLTTGQAVVGMTVFCGFVLESDSVNKPLMGWFLIVMNVLIVIVYRVVGGRDGACVGESAGVFGVRRRAPEEQDRQVHGAIQSARERSLQTGGV